MGLASAKTFLCVCPLTTDRRLFSKFAKSTASNATETCTYLVQISSSKLRSVSGQNWVIKCANPKFYCRRIGLTVKQLIETQASQSSAEASSFVYVFKYARCWLAVVEHVGTKNRKQLIFMLHFPFMAITAHGNVYVTWTEHENRVSRGEPEAMAVTLVVAHL